MLDNVPLRFASAGWKPEKLALLWTHFAPVDLNKLLFQIRRQGCRSADNLNLRHAFGGMPLAAEWLLDCDRKPFALNNL